MPSGRMGMGATAKAKDFKGTLKKLLKYLGNYKISLIFVIIFAICSAVFSIIGPKISGQATTEIFNGLVGKVTGTTNGIDFSKVGTILLTLLSLYIISAIFQYLQAFIMSGVNQKVTFNLREQISHKMHKLPLSYFESKTTGEILSRVTNDVDTLSQSLDQSISQILTSVTTLIGVIVMILSLFYNFTTAEFLCLTFARILIKHVVNLCIIF